MTENFQWFTRQTIDGSKGPYSTKTQVGKSANAGNEVANLIKNGNFWQLKNSDVKYAGTYNPAFQGDFITGWWTDNRVTANDALAYSTEALKGYDSNEDGSVSVDEFNSFYMHKAVSRDPAINDNGLLIGMPNPNSFKEGQAVDLNSDGKIDTGEMTAWQIYQDGQDSLLHTCEESSTASLPRSVYSKNIVDGKVTKEQAGMAETEACRDPNAVKAQLQKIYTDNNIAAAKQSFVMPKKVSQKPPVTQLNQFMQIIMMLIQMLMGNFGGGSIFGGSGGYSLFGGMDA